MMSSQLMKTSLRVCECAMSMPVNCNQSRGSVRGRQRGGWGGGVKGQQDRCRSLKEAFKVMRRAGAVSPPGFSQRRRSLVNKRPNTDDSSVNYES